MLRPLLLACCALALLITLPACDDTTDDGSFEGLLNLPGRSLALTGDAYYAEDRSGAEPVFVLMLTPNDLDEFDDPEFEDITVVVIRREGDRPNPGLTLISAPEDDGTATAFYFASPGGSNTNTATLIADSGTMTIDEFEDGELKGKFSLTGQLFDPGLENGSATASVSGTFEAASLSASRLPELAGSLPTGG